MHQSANACLEGDDPARSATKRFFEHPSQDDAAFSVIFDFEDAIAIAGGAVVDVFQSGGQVIDNDHVVDFAVADIVVTNAEFHHVARLGDALVGRFHDPQFALPLKRFSWPTSSISLNSL